MKSDALVEFEINEDGMAIVPMGQFTFCRLENGGALGRSVTDVDFIIDVPRLGLEPDFDFSAEHPLSYVLPREQLERLIHAAQDEG